MLYDMSPLFRPYLVGFVVIQPLSAVLLNMSLLSLIMAFYGLLILGDILTTALSCLIGPFIFSL
jgi:hypothetical protein